MRAQRVDANQRQVMQALRAIGADVLFIGHPVDLLVGYRGENWLLEVKDGSKPPSARRLTKAQAPFVDTWRGRVAVVKSVDEAIKAISC